MSSSAGCADGGDRAQGASRSGDEIAHAIDVEDQGLLVDAVDDALELADHAAPRARAARCWAWQMATASASAASEVDAVEAGKSILTIIATCRFSAWPTPTTVFLMRFAAYSATGRPVRAKDRERNAARLAEFQRRLRIAVDEGLLDRRLMRPLAFDQTGQQAMDRRQALGERGCGVGLDRAATDEDQPRAGGLDHAPAGRAQAGIDAEDANRADGHGKR